MLFKAILTTTTAAMAWSSNVVAAPRGVEARAASDLSLTAQLRLADTVVDRFKLLPDDKDFFYDFNDKDPATATASACSMTIVHQHPRAAELFLLLSGHVSTEMVPESGVVDSQGNQRVIRGELKPKQMTVFYQGSFHTQLNEECEPATAVTAFASEDMGTAAIANNVFSLSNETITSMFEETIKGAEIDKIRHALPTGLASKLDACVAKCGIKQRNA